MQVLPGVMAVAVPSTVRVTLLPRGALTVASATRGCRVGYEAYLLSDAASYVSGVEITVDGGSAAQGGVKAITNALDAT
ncbi:hypothetical protein N7U49_41430 [Streptomyces sp. AD2-2]|nr:hypothetical protein N7U49_41430 [Streptomyces sp. AD2-2]